MEASIWQTKRHLVADLVKGPHISAVGPSHSAQNCVTCSCKCHQDAEEDFWRLTSANQDWYINNMARGMGYTVECRVLYIRYIQSLLTDVCSVCLSLCLSRSLNRRRCMQCTPRAVCAGHSVRCPNRLHLKCTIFATYKRQKLSLNK